MELRRTFAVLLSTAACAAALMLPVPVPPPVPIEFAPPPQLAGADNFADGDATMAALRRQANAALASLQAAAAHRP